MLIELRDVLPADEVRRCRAALLGAGWVDGRATAGHLAIHAKRNRQLPVTDPVAREVGDRILDALGGNPAFIAATLPLKGNGIARVEGGWRGAADPRSEGQALGSGSTGGSGPGANTSGGVYP